MFLLRNPKDSGFFSQAITLFAPENLASGSVKYPIPANMSTTVSPVQSRFFILSRSSTLPEANITLVTSKQYLIPFSRRTDSVSVP